MNDLKEPKLFGGYKWVETAFWIAAILLIVLLIGLVVAIIQTRSNVYDNLRAGFAEADRAKIIQNADFGEIRFRFQNSLHTTDGALESVGLSKIVGGVLAQDMVEYLISPENFTQQYKAGKFMPAPYSSTNVIEADMHYMVYKDGDRRLLFRRRGLFHWQLIDIGVNNA